MNSLYECLYQASIKYPECVAVEVSGGPTLNYQEVVDWTHHTILALLRHGIQKNQRILVLDGDAFERTMVELAASYLGLTLVFVHGLPRGSVSEIGQIIEDAGVDWILGNCHQNNRALSWDYFKYKFPFVRVESLPIKLQTNKDRILVQCYTSGTTGVAKGVCLNEFGLVSQAFQIARVMHLGASDRVLVDGNINDMRGQLLMMAGIASASTLVMEEIENEGSIPELIECKRLTHVMLTPQELNCALSDPHLPKRDLKCLKTVAYGCAHMNKELLKQARGIISCSWLQGYGLTETSGPFCWLLDEQHKIGEGTVGAPAPGVCVEVRDNEGTILPVERDGHIWVRSPGIMAGYWNKKTREIHSNGKIINGWLHTGDIGFFDKRGFLVLKGRIDDVIILHSGDNVYPREIEEKLVGLPGVIDLAVVGLEDLHRNTQVPVLCIRTKKEHPLTVSMLKAHMKYKLTSIKMPHFVYFCNDPFPKGKNGKIKKKDLLHIIKKSECIPLNESTYDK